MPSSRAEAITTSVAKRVKELRVLRGFTQEGMARALGIATKNVQRLEGGHQNLTLRTLEALALVLDVEPRELLAPSGSPLQSDPTVSLRRALSALDRAGHRIVEEEDARVVGAIPVMTLEAAAGWFGESRHVEVFAWVKLKGSRADQAPSRFIAQVVGSSMTPTIPRGALCLFRAPVVGPLASRVVLVQLRTPEDTDDAGTYAVKRVGPIELRPEGGFRVQLLSDNREFAPMSLDVEQATELGILAELERVVWPTSSARRS